MKFYGLVTIGIIGLYLSVSSHAANDNVTSEDGEDIRTVRLPVPPRVRVRCPNIRNTLANGRVRIHSRGRFAIFTCKNGYEIVGSRFAICVRGQWHNPIPICVTNGCPSIFSPPNGRMDAKIADALIAFSCDPGYTLSGSGTIYCDGATWNDTAPRCIVNTLTPAYKCDFEDPSICGWKHDIYHDFDWRRHQLSIPSGHVGTGPSFDHTLGKDDVGHYMYIEASSPRKAGDTARLFSPVYHGPETTPGCFVFWYHMFGETIGSLRVFIKEESQDLKELLPAWRKTGPQGNIWLQGVISVPELKNMFQIVIEGICGSSYEGDIAIDDVALHPTPCEDLSLPNITGGADSCQQRCFSDSDANSTCSCRRECVEASTCCDDYQHFCTESDKKKESGLSSTEPPPEQETNSTEHLKSTYETLTTIQTASVETLTSGSSFQNATETTLLISSNYSSATSSQANLTKAVSISASTTSPSLTKGAIPVITPQSTMSETGNTTFSTTSSVMKSTPTINATENQTRVSTVNSTRSKSFETSSSQPTAPTTIKETTNSSVSISQQGTTVASSSKLPAVESKEPLATTSPKIPISFQTENLSSSTPSYASAIINQKTTALITTPRMKTTTTAKPATSKLAPSYASNKPTAPYSTVRTTPNASSLVTTSKAPSRSSSPKPTPKRTTRKLVTTSIFTFGPPMKTVSTRRSVATSQNLTSAAPSTPSQRRITNLTTSKSSEIITSNKSGSVSAVFNVTTARKPSVSTTVPSAKTRKPGKEKGKKSSPKPSKATKVTKQNTTPIAMSTGSKIMHQTESNPAVLPNNTRPYLKSTASISVTTRSSTRIHQSSTTPLPQGNRTINKLASTINNTSMTTAMNSSRAFSFSTRNPLTTNQDNERNTEAKIRSYNRTHNTGKAAVVETEEPSSSHLEMAETTPTITSKETQATWKPDFKSRTKYKTYPQKPTSKAPVSIVLVASVTLGSIAALMFLITILVCFICRKRRIAQNKLSDDSEMRFLSDSEIIEFVDPFSKRYNESAD